MQSQSHDRLMHRALGTRTDHDRCMHQALAYTTIMVVLPELKMICRHQVSVPKHYISRLLALALHFSFAFEIRLMILWPFVHNIVSFPLFLCLYSSGDVPNFQCIRVLCRILY